MITRQSPKPVSKDQLEKVSGMLQELPPKPKDELSLKEAIAEMYENITAALNRGYNHAEISEVLKGQGLQISSSTLKSYLAQVKPSDAPKRTKQPRKAKAVAVPEVVAPPEPSVPEAAAPSEAPKRGRKAGSGAKTAAKATAKPATIALDVPVSSEPPKRGRKPATETSTTSKAAKPSTKGEGAAAVKTTTRRRSSVGRGRREQGWSGDRLWLILVISVLNSTTALVKCFCKGASRTLQKHLTR